MIPKAASSPSILARSPRREGVLGFGYHDHSNPNTNRRRYAPIRMRNRAVARNGLAQDWFCGLWRSLVSALDWGSRGPGFKSRQPDVRHTPVNFPGGAWPQHSRRALAFGMAMTKTSSRRASTDALSRSLQRTSRAEERSEQSIYSVGTGQRLVPDVPSPLDVQSVVHQPREDQPVASAEIKRACTNDDGGHSCGRRLQQFEAQFHYEHNVHN